jgi:hypothetical protein
MNKLLQPTLYGNMTALDKIKATMTAIHVVAEHDNREPDMLVNIAILLLVAALNGMKSNTPDLLVADVGDCVVRSYAASEAWIKENEKG